MAKMYPNLVMARLVLGSQAQYFAVDFKGTMFTNHPLWSGFKRFREAADIRPFSWNSPGPPQG